MVLHSRLAYLAYYVKELDHHKFFKFFKFVRGKTGMSSISLLQDILSSIFKYNISILDYFYFKFYNTVDRGEFAGTGFMYEYQLRMNPLDHRRILLDKILFLKEYKRFIERDFATFDELRTDREIGDRFLRDRARIVLKKSTGQIGAGVQIYETTDLDAEVLLKEMAEKGFDLVEEYVKQHHDLNRLSPSGLNTIRVISQFHEGQVKVLAARLRITVNSTIDNLAAGNLAAPIDISSGIVTGPGVYSDITKQDEIDHPVTKEKIVGFQIPFWHDVLRIVREAALLYPQNRSIGWDVAITKDGPELIEGNHNWCKLLWQLPVGKGLKADLNGFD